MDRITISDSLLAMMRATIPLPGTAVIYSTTATLDSAGRDTGGSLTAQGTVACRIDPINSTGDQAQVIAGQETLKMQYQLTIPYDAPIGEGYRVTIAGRTYDVVELSDVHSYNISKRATLVEIR